MTRNMPSDTGMGGGRRRIGCNSRRIVGEAGTTRGRHLEFLGRRWKKRKKMNKSHTKK